MKRKRAPQALLDAATATFGYALIDGASGEILQANERLHEMLGWDEGELVGKPLDALVPIDRRAAHRFSRARYMSEPVTSRMGPEGGVMCLKRDGSKLRVWIGLASSNGTVAAAIMPTGR